MIARSEVVRLLGTLDDERIAEIVKLKPSLSEVELASMCLAGRMEVLRRSGRHLSATAACIMKIVLSDDVAFGRSR